MHSSCILTLTALQSMTGQATLEMGFIRDQWNGLPSGIAGREGRLSTKIRTI